MKICVYCSSSNAVDPVYLETAAIFGTEMARRSHSLVYGGGAVGLMGELARAVTRNGGHVTGIIPEALNTIEVAYQAADELIVAATMRERKGLMETHAEAHVALPGGFGTLDEVLEIITLKQLGYHGRPIVFLNTKNFFDPVVNLFEHLYQHKFAKDQTRHLYSFLTNPGEVFDYLNTYQAPQTVRKWF